MSKRGPSPKPTALKILHGTYKPTESLNEPVFEASAPSCPSWLSREAKREWRRMAPALETRGLLTEADRSAFAAYCTAYGDWYTAEKVVQKEGTTYTTATGYVRERPEVDQKRKAMKAMRDFLALFGLSPADRTRVNAPESKAAPSNPFTTLGTS